jgi:hypothetical protein
MFPPLEGDSNVNNIAGVTGTNSVDGPGVFGSSQDAEGVHGETNSPIFAAVAAFNNATIDPNTGQPATGAGVYGQSAGGGAAGFFTTAGRPDLGIPAGTGDAVVGVSASGRGVFGSSQGTEGVRGETNSPIFAAVAAFNNATIDPNTGQPATGAGVYGQSVGGGPAGYFTTAGRPELGIPAGTGDAVYASNGTGGYAIHAESGNGQAGLFEGDVRITGNLSAPFINNVSLITADIVNATTLTAAVKNFRIDHPLDPTNKYLIHATIESSERLNLYSGIAVLDAHGQAEVLLPDWFEALNCDFRYQLTCIGGFAPLFVATKILGNRFRIGGGYAGLEVSWQVVGCRHDRQAQEHPLMVVVDKTRREPLSVLGELVGEEAVTSGD